MACILILGPRQDRLKGTPSRISGAQSCVPPELAQSGDTLARREELFSDTKIKMAFRFERFGPSAHIGMRKLLQSRIASLPGLRKPYFEEKKKHSMVWRASSFVRSRSSSSTRMEISLLRVFAVARQRTPATGRREVLWVGQSRSRTTDGSRRSRPATQAALGEQNAPDV